MKKFLFLLLLLSSHILVAQNVLVNDIFQLDDAISAAVPGDTITMANGTWEHLELLFHGQGEPNNHIVLQAETPGKVIITGHTRFRIAGQYLTVSGMWFEDCQAASSNLIEFRRNSSELSQHCRLTESVIINCNPTNDLEDYKWVGIFGQSNEVDHCYLANKTHIGTTLVVWSTFEEGLHHVHHNYFGPRPRPVGDGNGYETIRVGTSTFAKSKGSNLVEHNYFYQTDGEIEIISGKSSYSTYRYNIFKNCRGGLTLRHGTNCRVEGNLFFGEGKSGSYGIRVIDRDHLVINNYFSGLDGGGSSIRNAISIMSADTDPQPGGVQHTISDTLAYNTVVNCRTGIVIGPGGDPVTPDQCVIVNNVVSIEGQAPVEHDLEPSDILYEGNFFHRSDGSVTIPDMGFLEMDPLLALAEGDSIYRPSENSPVIGAAIPGFVDSFLDFEGQERSEDHSCGADEPSSMQALDRGVFGPTWLDGDFTVSIEQESQRQGRGVTMSSFANEKIALSFPIDDQEIQGDVHVSVYSLDGSLIESEQLLKRGETIYLGQLWTPGQYLLKCQDQSGYIQVHRWVKW